MFSLFENSRVNRWLHLQSLMESCGFLSSERRGWGGGSGGDRHWVQPQIQGWSFF